LEQRPLEGEHQLPAAYLPAKAGFSWIAKYGNKVNGFSLNWRLDNLATANRSWLIHIALAKAKWQLIGKAQEIFVALYA